MGSNVFRKNCFLICLLNHKFKTKKCRNINFLLEQYITALKGSVSNSATYTTHNGSLGLYPKRLHGILLKRDCYPANASHNKNTTKLYNVYGYTHLLMEQEYMLDYSYDRNTRYGKSINKKDVKPWA